MNTRRARVALAAPVALVMAGLRAPLSAQATAPSGSVAVPVLPVERFVLPNGLTVLVSPDHAAPIVALTIWYHVGSKNEQPGHTGFAHLFEHVMFQGSEHLPKGEHIKIIEDAGGQMNGSTNNDRTNYYEVLPNNYLETALWLESDRMGTLLAALDQAKLDNQRDVVKNERRLRVDNQAYGRALEVQLAALYPVTNPYSWPVIGSMADLSAASLEDVKQFFRTYYAPDNAVLSISGDVDVASTKALVDRYFGAIPRGPDIARPTVTPTPLAAETRLVLEDPKASLPRLTIAWNAGGVRSPDRAALDALASLLAEDRTSRLTKRLVYDRELATSVTATAFAAEDEGTFRITVNPRPGVSLTTVEQVVDSVLASVAATPASATEIQRAKSYALVGTTTGLEPVLSRAETLARGQTFFGDPEHYTLELQATSAVTPDDVQRAAKQYLTTGRVVLSMVPAGKLDMVSKPAQPYTNTTVAPEGASRGGR